MNLENLLKQGNAIEDEIGLTIDDILHKITQEVGEFNDAVQKYRGRYCRTQGTLEDVESEFRDVLFNLLSLGYRLGIHPENIEEHIRFMITKFESRKELYKNSLK